MHGLIDTVALNVVAAIIFWLAFAHLPERHRRRRLRPKLDLGVYRVYRALFTMFDLIMGSASGFQNEIKGKKLRLEDIELGLQNKCLNETFLYDANVSQALMVVGRRLFETASEIDQETERVFNFSNYLTTREILLLEQIRGSLHFYDLKDFGKPARTIVGGRPFPTRYGQEKPQRNAKSAYLWLRRDKPAGSRGWKILTRKE